jgi:hypothetical protein
MTIQVCCEFKGRILFTNQSSEESKQFREQLEHELTKIRAAKKVMQGQIEPLAQLRQKIHVSNLFHPLFSSSLSPFFPQSLHAMQQGASALEAISSSGVL